MENMQKTPSRLRRAVRLLLFIVAGTLWLVEFIYLISARDNLVLPMTWPIFLSGAFAIQIFFVPALILSIPRDRFSPRRILIAFWLILTVSFWVFAPLYESLALYDKSRAGLIALVTNYIWEIPIIGGILILPFYHYFKRILNRFDTLDQTDTNAVKQLRRQLVYFPTRAGLFVLSFAVLALMMGFSVALPELMPPKREIVKNAIDVLTMGYMAGVFTFFVQSALIRPWLEKLPPPSYKHEDS